MAAAIADIGEDGGTPTHLALNPTEVTREATDCRPVRPDRMEQLQGLQIVRVPGLAEPLVYDATRIYAVVARDFRVVPSSEYAPAFKADKLARKVTGRFGVGLPVPKRGPVIRGARSRAVGERRDWATRPEPLPVGLPPYRLLVWRE